MDATNSDLTLKGQSGSVDSNEVAMTSSSSTGADVPDKNPKKLQQNGLDRKIAEALCKQKSQKNSKPSNVQTTTTKVSSNVPMNPTVSPSTSVKEPQDIKRSVATNIKPPKITITGPETLSENEKQNLSNLNAQQRLLHVKNILNKKILQKSTTEVNQNQNLKPPTKSWILKPLLRTEINDNVNNLPKNSEIEVAATSNSECAVRKTVEVLTPPLIVKAAKPDINVETKSDHNLNAPIPLCKSPQVKLPEKSKYTIVNPVCGIKKPLESSTPPMGAEDTKIVINVNAKKTNHHLTSPVVWCGSPINIKPVKENNPAGALTPTMSAKGVTTDVNEKTNHLKPPTTLSDIPQNKLPTTSDPQISGSLNSFEVLAPPWSENYMKQPLALCDTAQEKLHTKPEKEAPVQTITSALKRSVKVLTPPIKVKASKIPQKSPGDIARKFNFEADGATGTVHKHEIKDLYVDEDAIPKASIKLSRVQQQLINLPLNFEQNTILPQQDKPPLLKTKSTPSYQNEYLKNIQIHTKTFKNPSKKALLKMTGLSQSSKELNRSEQKLDLPEVSALSTIIVPKESTLPKINSFKIPYPVANLSTNDLQSKPETFFFNQDLVTSNLKVQSAASDSLVVLENKVLSQDEMIDLTELCLTTSKLDTPRFVNPHKPIPEVIIKEERTDEYPANVVQTPLNASENTQECFQAAKELQKQLGEKSDKKVMNANKQNKKVILSAQKLKLPPEQLADLAKKIKQKISASKPTTEINQANKAEARRILNTKADSKSSRKHTSYVLPSNTMIAPPNTNNNSVQLITKDMQIQNQTQHNVKSTDNGSYFNINQPNITTPFEVNHQSYFDKTSNENPKMPYYCSNSQNVYSYNATTFENSKNSTSLRDCQKSSVEIIDEPFESNDCFSAVDFITALGNTNTITEETSLELSYEELNLNAACTRNLTSISQRASIPTLITNQNDMLKSQPISTILIDSSVGSETVLKNVSRNTTSIANKFQQNLEKTLENVNNDPINEINISKDGEVAPIKNFANEQKSPQETGETTSNTDVAPKRISRFKKGKINLVQRNKTVQGQDKITSEAKDSVRENNVNETPKELEVNKNNEGEKNKLNKKSEKSLIGSSNANLILTSQINKSTEIFTSKEIQDAEIIYKPLPLPKVTEHIALDKGGLVNNLSEIMPMTTQKSKLLENQMFSQQIQNETYQQKLDCLQSSPSPQYLETSLINKSFDGNIIDIRISCGNPQTEVAYKLISKLPSKLQEEATNEAKVSTSTTSPQKNFSESSNTGIINITKTTPEIVTFANINEHQRGTPTMENLSEKISETNKSQDKIEDIDLCKNNSKEFIKSSKTEAARIQETVTENLNKSSEVDISKIQMPRTQETITENLNKTSEMETSNKTDLQTLKSGKVALADIIKHSQIKSSSNTYPVIPFKKICSETNKAPAQVEGINSVLGQKKDSSIPIDKEKHVLKQSKENIKSKPSSHSLTETLPPSASARKRHSTRAIISDDDLEFLPENTELNFKASESNQSAGNNQCNTKIPIIETSNTKRLHSSNPLNFEQRSPSSPLNRRTRFYSQSLETNVTTAFDTPKSKKDSFKNFKVLETKNSCHDTTQELNAPIPSKQRKRLCKTIKSTKKTEKPYRDTDSDDDTCDYDCEESNAFLGFEEPPESNSRKNTQQCVIASDQEAEGTHGTLKNWLTTGKAISPTLGKISPKNVLKTSCSTTYEETDITDDTSPADDEDDTSEPVSISRKPKRVIDISNKKLNDSNKIKLDDSVKYSFMKPRTKATNSGTESDSYEEKADNSSQEPQLRQKNSHENLLKTTTSNEGATTFGFNTKGKIIENSKTGGKLEYGSSFLEEKCLRSETCHDDGERSLVDMDWQEAQLKDNTNSTEKPSKTSRSKEKHSENAGTYSDCCDVVTVKKADEGLTLETIIAESDNQKEKDPKRTKSKKKPENRDTNLVSKCSKSKISICSKSKQKKNVEKKKIRNTLADSSDTDDNSDKSPKKFKASENEKCDSALDKDKSSDNQTVKELSQIKSKNKPENRHTNLDTESSKSKGSICSKSKQKANKKKANVSTLENSSNKDNNSGEKGQSPKKIQASENQKCDFALDKDKYSDNQKEKELSRTISKNKPDNRYTNLDSECSKNKGSICSKPKQKANEKQKNFNILETNCKDDNTGEEDRRQMKVESPNKIQASENENCVIAIDKAKSDFPCITPQNLINKRKRRMQNSEKETLLQMDPENRIISDASENVDTLSLSKKSRLKDKLSDSEIDLPSTPANKIKKTENIETPNSGSVRGRKLKYPNEANFNPRLLLITRREQIDTDDIITETEPGSGAIQCGLCLHRTQPDKWSLHLADHYGVGWQVGEQKVNIENRFAVLNSMVNYFKSTGTKGLNCRMCKKLYRSALGLLQHIESCGSNERVVCEFCKKDYTKISLPMHIRSCTVRISLQHKLSDESDNRKEEIFGNSGRLKRSSTIKAENKLKILGETLEKENIKDEKSKINPKSHIKYIPPMKENFSAKWSEDIKSTGQASCPKSRCKFTSANVKKLFEHLKKCKYVKSGYVCNLCHHAFSSENKAIDHVIKTHDNSRSRKKLDGSDCDLNNDFEPSSDEYLLEDTAESEVTDDSQNDSKEDEQECVKIADKTPRNIKNSYHRNNNQSTTQINRKELFDGRFTNLDNEVFKKWSNFFKSNYSCEPLYTEFTSQYTVMNYSNYSRYLPKQTVSMKFNLKNKSRLLSSIGVPAKGIEWSELKIFESINDKMNTFFFLGAPVKLCSWLPLPSHIEEQYLAVIYRQEMFKYIKFTEPKQHHNIVLIFKVILNNKTYELNIHYGFIVNDGPVHNLSFLPSGGYDESSNRLGLVALATVNSFVKVYSLPLNVELASAQESGCTINNVTLIDIEPSFLLNIDILYNKEKEQRHTMLNPQCLQICWSEYSGHQHIFAGFSNGFMGIWDISNDPEQNLNRFVVDDIINYAPLNYFYIGEKCIRCFALHYDTCGPRWLAVSAAHRKYLIYDIKNFSQPVIMKDEINKNVLLSMDWSPIWETVLFGYCDSLQNNGRCIMMVNPNNIMFSQIKLDHMTCGVTQVHYTPLTHLTVSATSNGDLIFLATKELHYDNVLSKKYGDRRIIYAMDVKQLNGQPLPKLTKENKKKDSTERFSDWRMQDDNYKEKYGLVFESLVKLKDNDKKIYLNENRCPPVNMLPILRINSLRCNLNSNGKNLIALGYENGFLRLVNFKKTTHFCN